MMPMTLIAILLPYIIKTINGFRKNICKDAQFLLKYSQNIVNLKTKIY